MADTSVAKFDKSKVTIPISAVKPADSPPVANQPSMRKGVTIPAPPRPAPVQSAINPPDPTQTQAGFRPYVPPTPAPTQNLATPQDVVPQAGVEQFGMRPLVRTPDPAPTDPYTGEFGTSPTFFGAGQPNPGELTEYTGEQSPGDQKLAQSIAAVTPSAQNTDTGLDKDGVVPPLPTGAAPSRVFTDAANAVDGGIVVTQDENGKNVYTKDGAVVDKASFAMTKPYAGGTLSDGTKIPAFTPGEGGYEGRFIESDGKLVTGPNGSYAISNNTAPEGGGLRQAAAGQAPTAVLTPGGSAVGTPKHFEAQRAQTEKDLIAGGMNATSARVQAQKITRKQVEKQLGGKNGIFPQDDTERAILATMPDIDEMTSAEELGLYRDAERRLTKHRKDQRTLGVAETNAQASLRTAQGGGRDAAQIRKDNADAALKEQEYAANGLGIDFKSAMDAAGNPIAGGLITWTKNNLSVPATLWPQIQSQASTGGALFNAIAADHPEWDSNTVLEHAYFAAMVNAGATPPKES